MKNHLVLPLQHYIKQSYAKETENWVHELVHIPIYFPLWLSFYPWVGSKPTRPTSGALPMQSTRAVATVLTLGGAATLDMAMAVEPTVSCGQWLRNPAPPKGWLNLYKSWHVHHLSTGAGFRIHPQDMSPKCSRDMNGNRHDLPRKIGGND